MRRPRRLLLHVLASLLALLLPTRFAYAAWPYDPNANVQVCNAGGEQRDPAAIPDGAGGAIVAWEDQRLSGNINIFVQHLSAAGAPQWANLSSGLVVCNATGAQTQPVLCGDGAGGAILAWGDDRSGTWALYAQHVSAAGAALWTANGVLISSNLQAFGSLTTASNGNYALLSDNQGGAYVAWATTANELRMQRLNGSGTALFPAGGVLLEDTHVQQSGVVLVADGSGGAIVGWNAWSAATHWDVLAQRVNASGTALWALGGVGVSTDPNNQLTPIAAPDGQGGAIFAWADDRNATYPIKTFAQHIGSGGAALWTGNGILIENSPGSSTPFGIIADGAGGAIVGFSDAAGDAEAQRINYLGVPQWGSQGEVVNSLYSSFPEMISDGAGGAILVFTDQRNGGLDVFAQRLGSSGNFLWNINGVPVCRQPAGQSLSAFDYVIPTLASDGAGGAIITWEDSRNDAGDIYAQRVERFGRLGNPEPAIARVSDVLADQGGEVQLQWTASYLDVAPTFEISDYSIWREAPAAAAQAALRSGATLLDASQPQPRNGAGGRLFRAQASPAGTVYWEYLVSVPARALAGYSHVTPTTTDSTGSSNLLTRFMVMAEDFGGTPFWASAPDSGYSVDNLPPGAPAPLAGAYLAGATHIHWGANTEPDLAGYRVYRGTSSGFVPGPGNLISSQPDTGYVDVGPAGSYYKLSAVDIHGNESAYSLLTPSGTTDVGGPGVPRVLSLADPWPNPARGRAMIGFALPRAGAVRLDLYDVDGRLVRNLVDGRLDAGRYTMPFDLRDAGERTLAGGLYYERLQADGHTLVRSLAILR